MRTAVVVGFVGAALVAAACGMRTSEPPRGAGSAPAVYTNAEEKFSFRLPDGWKEKRSRNPFRKPPYLVRYESPEGDAAAVVGAGPLGSETCIDAARKLLEATAGSSLKSEESFYVKTAKVELPAGQGMISVGERRGASKLFCDGDRVVVLEATADKAAYAKRKAELATILESFVYRGTDGDTPVAAAKVPPPPSYFVHVVKWRGQTLGKIAEWYTGNYDNWKELSSLNEITTANARLKLGREVKIPKGLVVQEQPIPEPKRKLATRRSKPLQKRSDPGAGAGEEEEPEDGEAPALPPVMGPR
ncbi:MAG: hypothetical protein ACREQQ_14510 [Candidatus Binatia bacterium]